MLNNIRNLKQSVAEYIRSDKIKGGSTLIHRNFTITLISFVLLSGCVNIQKMYDESLALKQPAYKDDIYKAATGIDSTKVRRGEKISFELNELDSIIEIDGIKSFYQVFSIEGSPGEEVKFTTFSPIQSSPNFYIILPRIFVVSPSGETIFQGSAESGKVSRESGRDPLHLEAYWEFKTPTVGEYRILFSSDNRNLGKEVEFAKWFNVLAGPLFGGIHRFIADYDGPVKLQVQ